jgi:hypothetical protein
VPSNKSKERRRGEQRKQSRSVPRSRVGLLRYCCPFSHLRTNRPALFTEKHSALLACPEFVRFHKFDEMNILYLFLIFMELQDVAAPTGC